MHYEAFHEVVNKAVTSFRIKHLPAKKQQHQNDLDACKPSFFITEKQSSPKRPLLLLKAHLRFSSPRHSASFEDGFERKLYALHAQIPLCQIVCHLSLSPN